MTDIHLLSPGHVEFSKIAKDYARSSYPSIENWEQLWKVWDIATRSMIPKDELLDKPIKLRNNLIFYLGHIPTFAGKLKVPKNSYESGLTVGRHSYDQSHQREVN